MKIYDNLEYNDDFTKCYGPIKNNIKEYKITVQNTRFFVRN